MTGPFLATWIALRRPAVLGGLYLATAAMTVAVTLLNFAFADEATVDVPANGYGRSVRALAGPAGPTAGMTVAVFGVGILVLCLAAATCAGHFTTGTLRTLLVRQPHRIRLLTGIWAALAAFGAGAVAVSTLTSVAVSPLAAGRYGVSTGAWLTADGAGTTLRAMAAGTAAAAGFATFGMALGLLLRAPVPAVATGFGWLFIVESLLPQADSGAFRWLPGFLLTAVAAHGTAAVTFGTAAGTVAVYLAVAVAAGTASFVRRDVVC
jgi:hypothetical protein